MSLRFDAVVAGPSARNSERRLNAPILDRLVDRRLVVGVNSTMTPRCKSIMKRRKHGYLFFLGMRPLPWNLPPW